MITFKLLLIFYGLLGWWLLGQIATAPIVEGQDE